MKHPYVLWCPECKWAVDARDMAMVNQCGNCGISNRLRFVHSRDESEVRAYMRENGLDESVLKPSEVKSD